MGVFGLSRLKLQVTVDEIVLLEAPQALADLPGPDGAHALHGLEIALGGPDDGIEGLEVAHDPPDEWLEEVLATGGNGKKKTTASKKKAVAATA